MQLSTALRQISVHLNRAGKTPRDGGFRQAIKDVIKEAVAEVLDERNEDKRPPTDDELAAMEATVEEAQVSEDVVTDEQSLFDN